MCRGVVTGKRYIGEEAETQRGVGWVHVNGPPSGKRGRYTVHAHCYDLPRVPTQPVTVLFFFSVGYCRESSHQ